jgi:hypothetical protein
VRHRRKLVSTSRQMRRGTQASLRVGCARTTTSLIGRPVATRSTCAPQRYSRPQRCYLLFVCIPLLKKSRFKVSFFSLFSSWCREVCASLWAGARAASWRAGGSPHTLFPVKLQPCCERSFALNFKKAHVSTYRLAIMWYDSVSFYCAVRKRWCFFP